MQDKTWYSILGLDAEPLFLQDHMLSKLGHCGLEKKKKSKKYKMPKKINDIDF